jgi:sugar phosphate isomerase/epimerase
MKTAIYTVTYNGGFYDGPALTLDEIFPRIAEMGFEGIEIGAKRPVASPLDLDSGARRAVRELSARHGVEIGCVASYSNLAGPILEHREAELVFLRETIRLAHDLEAPVVRVFAAWPGITCRDGQTYYELAKQHTKWTDVTWFEQWIWARRCLEEAAAWGEQYGVVLALQNHAPVTNTYQGTLEMIREVDSPWLKACIDAPHLADQSDEAVGEALRETGATQVWSHFGGYRETLGDRVIEDTGEGEIAVNYPAFFRGLHEIGYTGFVAYEGCGPALVGHQYRGVEEVDRRAKIALAYMQRQIAAAKNGTGGGASPGASTPREHVASR